jgi:hypothetical protein
MEEGNFGGLNAPAQSEVIGVLLILGITFASIGVIFALAQPTVSDARQDVTTDRVQRDMGLLDTRLSAAGFGTSENESVRLDLGQGRLFSRSNTTFMNVTVGGDSVYNGSIGSIEYRNGETSVAYEGGGLWRRTGNGTSMVSSPEIEFDGEALTVPVYNVTTDLGVGGVSTVSVVGGDNTRKYPNATLGRENPTDERVEIVIEDSKYLRAWARYLGNTVGADVTLDESQDRVEAELGPLDSLSQIDTSGVSEKEYNAPSNDPFNDGVEDGVKLPSVDSTIESYVEYGESNNGTSEVGDIWNCRTGPCTASGPQVQYNGSDYTMNGETFDVSGGNITVVVDGDLTIEDMELSNGDGASGNALDIITTGDLEFPEGYEVRNPSGEPLGDIVFHVPSNRAVTFEGGSGSGNGTIYAPDALVDLSGMGNSEWTGPVVGESLRADGVGPNADIDLPSPSFSVSVDPANDSYNLYVIEKRVGIDR